MTIADRLRVIVVRLDDEGLHVVAGDLGEIADDVERLEQDAHPLATPRCLPCRNGNHTGSNGTLGCVGDFCTCPCRSES